MGYDTLSVAQAVIFCNTRRKVDWMTEKMQQRDFTVSAMHGEMEQKERDVIMRIPIGIVPCTDHDRSARSWYRCPAGFARYQLRSAQPARELHSQNWSRWSFRT